MKFLSYLRQLLSTVFHRSRSDRELEEEIRSHIARQAEDFERSGFSREEAQRRARIAFGSPGKSQGKRSRRAPRLFARNPRRRHPIRPAHLPQISGLYLRRHFHSGSRHRRQHRHF
jgi:hypothetical protein